MQTTNTSCLVLPLAQHLTRCKQHMPHMHAFTTHASGVHSRMPKQKARGGISWTMYMIRMHTGDMYMRMLRCTRRRSHECSHGHKHACRPIQTQDACNALSYHSFITCCLSQAWSAPIEAAALRFLHIVQQNVPPQASPDVHVCVCVHADSWVCVCVCACYV
jgi:hypothetical protein